MIFAQNEIRQNLRSCCKQMKNLGTVTVPRFFIWQRVKDSNPHIQSQSLLCYPYTIPQYLLIFCRCLNSNIYYNRFHKKVNSFFEKIFKYRHFFIIRHTGHLKVTE